ncbi:MAG: hypothetical protein ACRD3O_09120, partial [Terriglobia bacterium]
VRGCVRGPVNFHLASGRGYTLHMMVVDDPEEFLRKVRQAAGRPNDPSPGLLRRPPSPEGEG